MLYLHSKERVIRKRISSGVNFGIPFLSRALEKWRANTGKLDLGNTIVHTSNPPL